MIVVQNGEKTLNSEKSYQENRQEIVMEKSNNNLIVDVEDLKKERNIHPKELSPVSMARSGINKSMSFENMGRE